MQRFVATSPTGRFADGAAAIDGFVLSHIEVHGKNIFYVSDKILLGFRVLRDDICKQFEWEFAVLHAGES